MADKAMNVYLNDHLAGAMIGRDLADHLRSENQGTPLGGLMGQLAVQIEEDRQTLIALMEHLDSSKNPVKQAGAWVAEKVSRLKFAGVSSGEPELGTFMALESLALGVQGKLGLWKALKQVTDQHPGLASVNLDELIDRAEAQYDLLERERLAAGARALGSVNVPRDRQPAKPPRPGGELETRRLLRTPIPPAR
jgi:hypothetical protein